jgi:hypothetical protein
MKRSDTLPCKWLSWDLSQPDVTVLTTESELFRNILQYLKVEQLGKPWEGRVAYHFFKGTLGFVA